MKKKSAKRKLTCGHCGKRTVMVCLGEWSVTADYECPKCGHVIHCAKSGGLGGAATGKLTKVAMSPPVRSELEWRAGAILKQYKEDP